MATMHSKNHRDGFGRWGGWYSPVPQALGGMIVVHLMKSNSTVSTLFIGLAEGRGEKATLAEVEPAKGGWWGRV